MADNARESFLEMNFTSTIGDSEKSMWTIFQSYLA